MRTILRGSDELVASDDPLEAEVWASAVLGTTYKAPLPIGVQDRFHEAVWDGVLTRAEARGGEGPLAVLRALAAVADPPLATRATEAADRLAADGVPEPERRGRWSPTEGWGGQVMMVVPSLVPVKGSGAVHFEGIISFTICPYDEHKQAACPWGG